MYSMILLVDCCGGCQTFSVLLIGVKPGQRRRAISRGGLRTLSRRGSGVRIPSPAPFQGRIKNALNLKSSLKELKDASKSLRTKIQQITKGNDKEKTARKF